MPTRHVLVESPAGFGIVQRRQKLRCNSWRSLSPETAQNRSKHTLRGLSDSEALWASQEAAPAAVHSPMDPLKAPSEPKPYGASRLSISAALGGSSLPRVADSAGLGGLSGQIREGAQNPRISLLSTDSTTLRHVPPSPSSGGRFWATANFNAGIGPRVTLCQANGQ